MFLVHQGWYIKMIRSNSIPLISIPIWGFALFGAVPSIILFTTVADWFSALSLRSLSGSPRFLRSHGILGIPEPELNQISHAWISSLSIIIRYGNFTYVFCLVYFHEIAQNTVLYIMMLSVQQLRPNWFATMTSTHFDRMSVRDNYIDWFAVSFLIVHT